MEVVKSKNELELTAVSLIEKGKELTITTDLLGDVHIGFHSEIPSDSRTFVITRENYDIYQAFEKLYEDIKTGSIYTLAEGDSFENEWEKREMEEEIVRRNALLTQDPFYSVIFQNERICFFSDDEEELENANILTIQKNPDSFILCFHSPYKNLPNCDIRVNREGSNCAPFHLPFLRFHDQFTAYDPAVHQTQIDELIFKKEKKREA